MHLLNAWFQPGNHELATQALLALTAPIIKLGARNLSFWPVTPEDTIRP
jgi:hypothetical protein